MNDDKTAQQQNPTTEKPDRFPSGAPMAPASGDEIPVAKLAAKWGVRIFDELKSFGKRVFVHILVVVCAVVAAPHPGGDILGAGLCLYIGGICILARGMGMTPAWLIPAGAGVMQTIILVGFGFLPPQALFWGGVQSWVQRLFHKRLHMGGEWGMLLFILPMATYLLPDTPLMLLSTSFVGLAVCGGLVARGIARREEVAVKLEEMKQQGPLPSEKIRIYRKSLEEFNSKIVRLPANVRPLAQSIAGSTGNILECMATDSRDIEPGHRFLNRYFKAAHSVVDSHLSLSREGVVTREMAEALDKSRETLARLDEVFAKEHTRLLQNDITDFSADLAVIDTLLKMDGK